MKNQNVVLKVGIGLVLGIGAMTLAPKMARASTPCDSSPKDITTCPHADAQYSYTSTLITSYSCFDTNCDHKDDSRYRVDHTMEDFWYYPSGGGPGGDNTLTHVNCDSYHYTKVGSC